MSNNKEEITLTDDNIKQIDCFKDKWYKKSLQTHPADPEIAKDTILRLYDCIGVPRPKKGVKFCSGPLEAIKIAKEYDGTTVTVYDFIYGQLESGMGAFFDFFKNEVKAEQAQDTQPIIDFAENCGWTLLFEEMAIVCDRMSRLELDENDRLHSLDGPAVEFRDGSKLFYVHDVPVDEYVIMNPEQITVEDIEKEENAEVKRVKINQYGQERYIQDSGAKLIAKDDIGELYIKEIENDEPLVMVKVINSTAEPDGTYKEYWLRVPPDTTTPTEGVASTWRDEENNDMIYKNPEDYPKSLVFES